MDAASLQRELYALRGKSGANHFMGFRDALGDFFRDIGQIDIARLIGETLDDMGFSDPQTGEEGAEYDRVYSDSDLDDAEDDGYREGYADAKAGKESRL